MELTTDQKDVLTEIVNIGVGKAGSMLSDMVEQRIELRVPSVEICTLDSLPEIIGQRGDLLDTAIFQDFQGSVSGRSILAFPRESGLKLAQLLGGLPETPDEFDIDLSGILVEVGNIVMNGVLGSISNILQSSLAYTVPELSINSCLKKLAETGEHSSLSTPTVIYSDVQFSVSGDNLEGSLVLMFQLQEIEKALNSLLQTV
jgi:chemotaxis protein CheC